MAAIEAFREPKRQNRPHRKPQDRLAGSAEGLVPPEMVALVADNELQYAHAFGSTGDFGVVRLSCSRALMRFLAAALLCRKR